jgi:TPR repeat protein
MTSSVSLKYLIRILKYDAKVLEQPFPYHIFKRVLFFEFNRLIQTTPYSHKTANVIMQIAGYMKVDQVAFEFHHLFIRHTLTLGLFEEANQYIQSLQALGEKSEHIEYYRFFVDQKITSIDHILAGTPVLADATFEMVSNRLLSTDNLRLAKQWLLLQDFYTKVRTMDALYPKVEKAMKDYFKAIKFDGALHWQYKIGLFAKHYEGPIFLQGQEIISNVFFESINLFQQPVIYLGKIATLMFRGDYVFQYPFQLHLHPGVKFIEGDQTFIVRTPLHITMKKGEDSDVLLMKLRLLDTYQLAKLGDASAMNLFGILSSIGIERFEDFNTLPEVQQSLVRFLLNQHVEDAKTWLNQSRKYHAFASLIAKTMIDVPMLSTPSLMGLLSGQALGKPKPMTIQLFKDAVDGYAPQAMHNLAYFYLFGEGVDKRVDLAADLWMKAVERGESFSEGSLYNAVLIHQALLKDEKIKDFIQLYKKEVFLAKEALEKTKQETQPIAKPPVKKPVEETPVIEIEVTSDDDIWTSLNHPNKAVAKATFAKVVDQHQAGQVQATLLLSAILVKGFQYMQADIQKALQILEDSCMQGNQEACQRFVDVVKDGVMKNTLPKTEALRQRILTIQQKLKKD